MLIWERKGLCLPFPLAPRGASDSPLGVMASFGHWVRTLLPLGLLTLARVSDTARVSSSLSTTHHVHHFHNKHGTVPIAINRTPFLTRGGHGEYIVVSYKATVFHVQIKAKPQYKKLYLECVALFFSIHC